MYKSRMRKLEKRMDALKRKSVPSVSGRISGMSIGENIKLKRKALNMTQEELAEAVGLGRSMVAQIERGTKSPTLSLSVDIARVLQCDLNALVE